MHFASGAFSLSSFSFTRHCYAVICVSRLEYIGFVSISLKDDGSVLFEKAAGVVITEEALRWGFCCVGGIINTK